MSELLRIYDPDEVGLDGYPIAWHHDSWINDERWQPIKVYVRALEGHRCERCRHPYPPRIAEKHPRGEWTPCDELCSHDGPLRYNSRIGQPQFVSPAVRDLEPESVERGYIEAQWRILTVHHLNGVKWDCRWWNLAALCQRCHLTIQGKVLMERVYPLEHSEWFKPHAAGWYATAYLNEDLTREQTMEHLDELLALERAI